MHDRVAVIVPVFNASATVLATLESVSAQSYRNLEIIVVDDGSTDDSAAIVAEYAYRDPRVVLIRQCNLGVASARNTGAASTTADFLSFVDADDLWANSKIEMQMDALRIGGQSVGLVYCWFARLNADGIVLGKVRPTQEGSVLKELCREHFIGNGSSLLMRRIAFEAAGGYDTSLRARHAQGCEDLLIAMRIAEKYEFRLVKRHLVGYRLTDQNMSSDVLQMLRSFEIILGEYKARYPMYATELQAHLVDCIYWGLRRALRNGKLKESIILMGRLFSVDFSMGLASLPHMTWVYLSANAAPRWLKRWARTLLNHESEVPRIYSEEVW
jgi:glycosyltransferase involved in cell wall biosynthesis